MLRIFTIALLTAAAFLTGCGPSPTESSPDPTPTDPEPSSFKSTWWAGILDLGAIPLEVRLETVVSESGEIQSFVFHNAEETIEVNSIVPSGDSMVVQFPVFESALHVAVQGEKMAGTWHNDARTNNNRIPFSARVTESPTEQPDEMAPSVDITGIWEVEFDYEGEKTPAIGHFEQEGSHLTGTFQTETGDYRFLEGRMQGNDLYLSCFDGAHAFAFSASVPDNDHMSGDFYSGKHWHETWTAMRNPDVQLSDPDELTRMKPGETTLDFTFLNTQTQPISPSDPQFSGKALVIQIMGTWCPNCKDEAPFLQEMYERYHSDGLEMISIGFEMSTDTARSLANLQRLKDHFGIEYDVVFGGKAGRRPAGAALPQLEHVMSYPTTIFMDRNHEVQRIYTGFSGPAVKGTYEKLTISFEETIQEILQEG